MTSNSLLLRNDFEYGSIPSPKLLASKNSFQNHLDDMAPAPKMSEEFYQDFEGFLLRPTPKLQEFHGFSNEMKMLSDTKQKFTNHRISSIKTTDKKIKINTSSIKLDKITQKSKDYGTLSNSKISKPRQADIDINLLQEAFRYANYVSSNNLEEDSFVDNTTNATTTASSSSDNDYSNKMKKNPQNQRSRRIIMEDNTNTSDQTSLNKKSGSAPMGSKLKKVYLRNNNNNNNNNNNSSSSSSNSNSGNNGLVDRLRSQTSQGLSDNNQNQSHIKEDFIVVATLPSANFKRIGVDYDSLIDNFQNGLTLQKLKEELTLSQEALYKTQSDMKDIVRDTIEGTTRVKRK